MIDPAETAGGWWVCSFEDLLDCKFNFYVFLKQKADLA